MNNFVSLVILSFASLREISVPIPKSWREIFLRGVPGPAETFEISRDSLLPLAFSPGHASIARLVWRR
jgi:hypothetical protein